MRQLRCQLLKCATIDGFTILLCINKISVAFYHLFVGASRLKRQSYVPLDVTPVEANQSCESLAHVYTGRNLCHCRPFNVAAPATGILGKCSWIQKCVLRKRAVRQEQGLHKGQSTPCLIAKSVPSEIIMLRHKKMSDSLSYIRIWERLWRSNCEYFGE